MNCLLLLLPAVFTVIHLNTQLVNCSTSHRLNALNHKHSSANWSRAGHVRSNFKSKLLNYNRLHHVNIRPFNHRASVALVDAPLPRSLYSALTSPNNNQFLERSSNSGQTDSRSQLSLPFVKTINQQLLTIHNNYSCKVPKPKLIYVRSQYSVVGKKYYPSCAVLHVCSDDIGCCFNEAYTCAAKSSVQVKMYFHVLSLETNQSDIEALDFVNDTECECREINPRPRSIYESYLSPLDDDRSSSNLIFERQAKPLDHQQQQMQMSSLKSETWVDPKYQQQLEQLKQLQEALAGKDERVSSGEKNNTTGSPLVTDGLNFDHLSGLKFEPPPLEPLKPPKEPAVTNYDELIVPLSSPTTLRIMESSSTTMETTKRRTTTMRMATSTTPAPSTMSPLHQSTVTTVTPFTQPPVTHHPVKSVKSKEFEPGEISSVQCSYMRCPLPFVAIVERPHSVKCTCDCSSDSDIECIRIKRGLAKLKESQGRCVRMDRCQPPRCEYSGDFDTKEYRCPAKSSELTMKHPNRVDERD